MLAGPIEPLAGSIRRRSRRGRRLLLESLEDRRLLTMQPVPVGGLLFEAPSFNFNAGTDSYTTSGTVEVGLDPGSGTYVPLLNLNGNIEIDAAGSDPTFSVYGSVTEALTGQNVPLIQGNDTFHINELVNTGLSTLDGQSFTVAGAAFTLDDIQLADTAGGPEVQLQGSLTVPGLDGLTIAVDGANQVDISSSGIISLTGVDASLNGSIQIGGLSFDASALSVAYSHTAQHDTFTVTGATSFTLGSDTVDIDWGGTTSQGTTTEGLVIQDGTLTNLDMAVTGSLGVGGLSFHPDDLDITYQAEGQTFTASGAADFSVDGDTLDVNFGGTTSKGTTTHGLVIKDGTLTNLDMAVTGSFSVGDLSFHPDDLTVTYAASSQTYTVAGAADFALGSDTLDVDFGGTTSKGTTTQGLVIKDGTLTNLDMAVTGSFSVGGLSIQADDLTVTYTAATDTYTVSGGAEVSLDGSSVDVQFGGTTPSGAQSQGLVITDGSLVSLDMGVTGSFSLLGVTLAAQNLTFQYDATQDQYEMSGTLAISTASQADGSGGTGQVFDGVSATLGQGGNPGLVVTDGTLESLDIIVNGSFDLFGVTVAPMTSRSATTPATACSRSRAGSRSPTCSAPRPT